MKEYKVPVAWVMCGFVTVRAESAVEAYEKAEKTKKENTNLIQSTHHEQSVDAN